MDADLFAAHVGYATRVANSMRLPWWLRDEARQWALIGLWQAAESWDPAKTHAIDGDAEAAFRAWAARKIRYAVLDGLRERDPLPLSARRKIRAVTGLYESLAQQHGREPTWAELDAAAGADTVAVVVAAQRAARPVPTDAHPDVIQLRDPHPQPHATALHTGLREALNAATAQLPPHLEVVIELRYWSGLTQRDIAHLLGVTPAAVSQRETRALRLLRDTLTRDWMEAA